LGVGFGGGFGDGGGGRGGRAGCTDGVGEEADTSMSIRTRHMQGAVASIRVYGREKDCGGGGGEGCCGRREEVGKVSEGIGAGEVEDVVYYVGIEGYGGAGGHGGG